jgi:hypothetical protein
MKTLTAERVRDLLSYDPETGWFRWRANRTRGVKAGDRAGSVVSNGYRRLSIDGVVDREHRIAWLVTHGEWPNGQIDHINGVKDDNRIANLREATAAQNRLNTGAQCRNTSGYRGVTFHKALGKWQAQIIIKGRMRYLGLFTDPKIAAHAYDKVARELHGTFYRRIA